MMEWQKESNAIEHKLHSMTEYESRKTFLILQTMMFIYDVIM